jgi:hypothetical protein
MYWPITAAKALVTALSLLVVLRVMKNRSFSGERGPGSLVYNGVPVLLLPVLLVSPLIWEHHPVLVALPYLLLLKRLASPGEWTVYAFAYFLQFVMPTFDFFPWSFARLLSLLAILWLIHATAGRPEDGPLLPALSRLLGAGGRRA